MKHIKNSIKGSIFLLEHAGVPVALSTDFSEPIKNGSLCVNTTNQDLYILKNNVWVMMGAGFNMDDWIPRRGTDINKPVFGDIEIVDGIRLYSGQSDIMFSDELLKIGFSDNQPFSDNFSLLLDRNVVLKKDFGLLTIDSSSRNNTINKVTTITAPGVTLSGASDNTIESNLTNPADFQNFNYNKVSGTLLNTSTFGYTSYSKYHLYATAPVTFVNGFVNDADLSVEQIQPFTFMSNAHTKMRGRIYGNVSAIQNSTYNYIEGTFKDTVLANNTFVNFYGNITNSNITSNQYLYNLGHITANNGGILSGVSSTSSRIDLSNNIFNLGILGNVDLQHLNDTLFLGKNTSIKANLVNGNTFINNNGYSFTPNANKNILLHNDTKLFTTNGIYSKLEDSTANILINNNAIYSTSSNYNLIINTDDVKLYGSNSLVYTPRETFSGFTGKITGGNNVIFSLKPNKNYTIKNNVFTFGDINSTSGVHINDGNILMGNVDIDSTLTTNNQIFGAKRLQNINHSGQLNNIFLNVDNFDVPDSNTVYLPFKFYGINLGYYGAFNLQNITANRNWNFPDKSGTVALVEDITTGYLNDLEDVNITNVQNGQVLTYNTASTSWVNQIISTGVDELTELLDVNINNAQNGDFLVYNSASTSWINLDIPFLSGTNMIIDISYGDLYSLWSSSGLITGAYYRFDYQTIHKIPYTSTINYAPVEKLIAFAIAPNKLDKIVWSPSHPEDIIYYRIDDRIANSTVEDITLIDGDTSGSVGQPYIVPPATVEQAYLPTVIRPGRIYYREDTIARCSAPYDIRGVKFRRYKLKYPYELASTTKPYLDGTVLNTGDIVKVNGNIYMAKFLFTCSTSGGTLASDVTFFYNITNYLNNSLLQFNYVCPTPDTYVLADNRDTPYSSLILKVDNTQYFDFSTFDNNVLNGSQTDNNFVRSYNCNIENYIPAWLEQVSWEYYPNIVFSNYSNNINIGIFSENLTIVNSCNVDIDNYCKNMFVSTYNSYLCQTKIGARCENIFIENVYVSGANSQTNYLYHTIGIGNKNIINSKIANITIGDKNLSLYMFATQETRIGSQNQFTGFFGFTSGAEISQSKLGDFNSNICYSHVTYNNYIGDKNNLIILPTASHDNVIGNNNNYISGIKTAVDSMEGVSVGGAFYENTIGSNNNNITLAGFQNVVESNVEGIYATEYVTFNNLVFKSGSGNLLIDSGTNSILSMIGCTFDYNRQLFGGLKTLTLNIQPISYNFLNYNMYDFSGGNTLVALRFVAYTDPTTYTMIAQRLYLT